MTEEPVFLPSPEGAERVIVAARHRRRRKVGAFASSVAFGVACVLGVAALSGSTRNGAEQLTVTDSSTPTPARATSSPVPNITKAPLSAGSRPAVVVGPTTASSDDTVSSPPPASPRSTVRRTSPIYRSTRTDTDTTDLCSGGAGGVADWCLRTTDPGVVHRGTPVRLRGELCRLQPSQAATITFSDTREAVLEVSDGSAVEWQGGEGIRYRSPGRTVTVQPGTCLVWSSVWDTRDRDGFLVPPGSYDFSISIQSQLGFSVGSTITVVD